jgi:hypothetical protein
MTSHTSVVVSMRMQLVALLSLVPALAFADEKVELNHLPEGKVERRSDGQVIVYTFDQFKVLAKLDVNYTAALTSIESLKQQLDNRVAALKECKDHVAEQETSFAELNGIYVSCDAKFDDAVQSFDECNNSLNACIKETEKVRWWHPVWGPIAIGSLSAITALIAFGE